MKRLVYMFTKEIVGNKKEELRKKLENKDKYA